MIEDYMSKNTMATATLWDLLVTEDHSLVAEQVRNGYINEEQARTHALRNLITRAVGTKEAVSVDLFAVGLEQGDTVMVCSDGLTGVVSDREISKALAIDNLQGAARSLVGRALKSGGPDNITVAVARVAKEPPLSELQPGAVEVKPKPPGFFGKIRKFFV